MVIARNDAVAAPQLGLHQFWAGALHNPETAADWDEYVDRFLDPPFGPHQEGFNERLWDAPFYWLGLENEAGDTRTMALAWVDIWVFYSLMVGTP